MPFDPFDNEIRREKTRNKFLNETQVSRIDPGSKARSLMDALFEELSAIEDNISEGISQLNPDTADGVYIDIWADIFGETREPSTLAGVSVEDEVVRFFVENGTFGDLNDGNNITIAVTDVIISGEKKVLIEGEIETSEVEYRLDEDVTLSSADSEQWISVTSIREGQDGNMPKGALINHDFINYATYPDRMLKVENVEPISNGEDEEDDEVVKSKYLRSQLGRSQTLEARLTSLADAVPGVTNAYIIPFFSGPATTDLFIDTETFTVPNNLIIDVGERLNEISVPGTKIRVYPVERVGVAMDLDVSLKTNITDTEIEQLRTALENVVIDTVVNTPIGGAVNMLDLHGLLSVYDANILQIGTQDQPYASLLIYREGVDNRVAEQWDPDEILFLEDYERLFIEDSLVTPITISINYTR